MRRLSACEGREVRRSSACEGREVRRSVCVRRRHEEIREYEGRAVKRSNVCVSRGKLSRGRQGWYDRPSQPTRLPSHGSGSGRRAVQEERACSGSEDSKAA